MAFASQMILGISQDTTLKQKLPKALGSFVLTLINEWLIVPIKTIAGPQACATRC
jgi:hypothetical protein